MSKSVILTGLRANNDLHIGNYLGALLPIVDLAIHRAGEYQVNLFVPDLHSFTTPINHHELQAQIIENLKVFVAAGLPLDHPDVHVYRQSYVPAHSELTWILDCFTGVGELQRMTQFKDKSQGENSDRISVGLFNYPVLMASDILLYGASYVPVGDDQTQHLEYTRDIAMRVNSQFEEVFTIPKPVKEQHAFFGKEQGLRIKDLTDPSKKMSKSNASPKGIIYLSDDTDQVKAKIMSATTDSLGQIRYDKDKQPGIANLLELLALFSDKPLDEVIGAYQGQDQYGPLKSAVSDAIVSFLEDFQHKLSDVSIEIITQKLTESEQAMNEQANATLKKVQRAVGLR
jgi:tryptophanyl-tRNA synthetase